MIGMFRKQLISMDNKQQQHSSNGNSPIETLDFQIRIIVRFRPVNDKEKAIEQRIMFRNEFDMDDNDFDRFMKCRMLLMQNEESLIDWRVDEVCAWLETMEYDLSVVGRFRRRKVNGDWLLNFPPFLEKKPLEIERDCVVSFNMKDQSHTYESDVVLNDNCTQDECFQEIGPPIVHDIIAGYNYTIFAYGQTGTGKTHTMFGAQMKTNATEEERKEESTDLNIRHRMRQKIKNAVFVINEDSDGIIPRTVDLLFKTLKCDDNIYYSNVSCAFIEIYNEKIRDLIRPKMKLTLRYIGLGSGLVNLSWHDVNNTLQMLRLIETAKMNRVTAQTAQNETSSRSHCIIQMKIEITLRNGCKQVSFLNFGDLAGSEKITKTGAMGTRLREAKKIVQSLFALKKTIRALAEKKAFVPYQESILTKLLRDSLGGNCKTSILCTMSPHAYNREETLSTLRFAEMAGKIKNEANINRLLSRTDMEQQINELREQLQYHRKKIAQRSNRFTSTDFRVLQSQLMKSQKKSEEYQSRYLQSEIQLLIKTQYCSELEILLHEKNHTIQMLQEQVQNDSESDCDSMSD